MISPFLVLMIAAIPWGAPAQETATPGAGGARADGSVTLLQLRDGRIEWGSIRSHDPDSFVFERLDNGGIARLPWNLLDPGQEQELKSKLGYIDLTGDEVMIDADRIVTTDGTEFLGKILDRTADSILLKTSSATIAIRKDRIGGAATTVPVRALEVFSKQELYDQQALANPPTDAAGHFALAMFCERIFDFQRAVEHYQKAAEADPAFRAGDVRLAIARASEKAKHQDQIDYLAGVESELARKHFDKALAMADAFPETFPSSPLIPDAKKKHDRIIKARDRFVADRVARQVITRAGALAHQAALEKSFEEAVAYTQDTMRLELYASVAKDMQKVSREITPEVVRQMWAGRRKILWHTASYGLGTWLLGKDEALKGMEEEKEDKKPVTEADKQRADLEKKIKAFLQNQEMARKAQSQDERGQDRDGFWKGYPAMSRAQWLLAYFVENSGDFEVAKHPRLANCPDCGGQGTREISIAGANVAKSMTGKGVIGTTNECTTCHGIGKIRRIAYR
jgi:tetratricopeptide (TPR) repeat protein